jgi:hypothetical protein
MISTPASPDDAENGRQRRFIDGHVLVSVNGLARHHLDDPIDQQKG